MRMKYFILASVLILLGCNMNESSYTLYKIDPADQSTRKVVDVFGAFQTDKENLAACHKARMDILTNDAQTTDKYWCEKGGG